jgi:hypothetical protein
MILQIGNLTHGLQVSNTQIQYDTYVKDFHWGTGDNIKNSIAGVI